MSNTETQPRTLSESLERLGRAIAEKTEREQQTITESAPQPKPTAQIVQLPIWPEPVRAMPNPALRSALFPAIQSKNRRFLNDELLNAVQGVEIHFKGEQLNQEDLDVCAQVYHLARCHPLGDICHMTAHGFLKSIDRRTSGREHDDLHKSLRRLMQPLEIKIGRYHYSGALIMEGIKDDETRHYCIRINPKLAGLFGQGWTGLDWNHRQALRGKPLALWLQAFYATHADPFAYKVETLRELCGSQTTILYKFRQSLRIALKKLETVGAIQKYEIDKSDLVHVFKTKIITQKKPKKQRNA
jgi:TrfA protein